MFAPSQLFISIRVASSTESGDGVLLFHKDIFFVFCKLLFLEFAKFLIGLLALKKDLL